MERKNKTLEAASIPQEGTPRQETGSQPNSQQSNVLPTETVEKHLELLKDYNQKRSRESQNGDDLASKKQKQSTCNVM